MYRHGSGRVPAALGGMEVFTPLLLHVDEGPLTAAKTKMLDTRKQQIVFRAGRHQAILSQVTPAGSSDTVTV